MALFTNDSQLIKSIGASGQLSLGKEFAGRQELVESPAKGVWIIRTATVIPDNETWLHEKKTKVSLKKAISWASKNPPMASDPNQLLVKATHAAKRKTHSTGSK